MCHCFLKACLRVIPPITSPPDPSHLFCTPLKASFCRRLPSPLPQNLGVSLKIVSPVCRGWLNLRQPRGRRVCSPLDLSRTQESCLWEGISYSPRASSQASPSTFLTKAGPSSNAPKGRRSCQCSQPPAVVAGVGVGVGR